MFERNEAEETKSYTSNEDKKCTTHGTATFNFLCLDPMVGCAMDEEK